MSDTKEILHIMNTVADHVAIFPHDVEIEVIVTDHQNNEHTYLVSDEMWTLPDHITTVQIIPVGDYDLTEVNSINLMEYTNGILVNDEHGKMEWFDL